MLSCCRHGAFFRPVLHRQAPQVPVRPPIPPPPPPRTDAQSVTSVEVPSDHSDPTASSAWKLFAFEERVSTPLPFFTHVIRSTFFQNVRPDENVIEHFVYMGLGSRARQTYVIAASGGGAAVTDAFVWRAPWALSWFVRAKVVEAHEHMLDSIAADVASSSK
jgi:hypothetical protein